MSRAHPSHPAWNPRSQLSEKAGPAFVPLLDGDSGVPLQRRLYTAVRDAIRDGRLFAGARLPSSRDLARQLGVARMTVVLAYEALRAEGYLTARQGAGTFVSPEAAAVLASRGRRLARGAAGARPPERAVRGAPAAGNHPPRPTPSAPFHVGEPAIDAFPIALWARLLSRRWRSAPRALLTYGDPAGYRPLREAIADHLAARRGVRATPDQVIVTHGAQQALDLVARVVIASGDVACVEDPAYPGAVAALRAAGARVVPVPVDSQGLDAAALVVRAPAARLVYLTPSHQFPTGVTLSLARRRALLEWARRAGAWLVEDDYDSEFRYTGAPLTALQGLDAEGRVLYVGSFSKTMLPALGIGYAVIPEPLIDAVRAARIRADHHGSGVEHAALADFIADGHFARHLRRTRLLYAGRRAAFIDALAPMPLSLGPCDAGLHAVGWLTVPIDAPRVVREARQYGVWLRRVSSFALEPLDREGFLLGFGGFPSGDITRAAALLRRLLEDQVGRGR